ncbi:hypothetical protein F4680DRAFT_421182 [Xylaria scruposa]|nr:hypothetical protein F4680DRAFT_421182 [Xylaria scruposa]
MVKPVFNHSSIMPQTRHQKKNQPGQQDNHNGDEANQPSDQRSGGVALTDRSRKASATAKSSGPRSLFSTPTPQPSSSSSYNDLDFASIKGPPSTKASTKGQGTARPKSPIKHPIHLCRLEIEVNWADWVSAGKLSTIMNNAGSGDLYQSVVKATQGRFLPTELRSILEPMIGLRDDSDILFAERPVRPFTQLQLHQAKLVQDPMSKSSGPPQLDNIPQSLSDAAHMQSLIFEFETLCLINTMSIQHIQFWEGEASWNDDVHKSLLQLATQHTPSVLPINITRANIAKEFLPKASDFTSSVPTDSKIIDYAMVIRPEKDEKITKKRFSNFCSRLGSQGFNQSSYCPLQNWPSGVFIETKAYQNPVEAQIQLGIWLASWFNRVLKFPIPNPTPPPVLPVILVQNAAWDLWFAIDESTMENPKYELYGPVRIGATDSILEVYRLLAALRVLADWMATDFRDWVNTCLLKAGVF